jgi:hypothetical protein
MPASRCVPQRIASGVSLRGKTILPVYCSIPSRVSSRPLTTAPDSWPDNLSRRDSNTPAGPSYLRGRPESRLRLGLQRHDGWDNSPGGSFR